MQSLDRMDITQHLGPICKGAGIGFLVELASVATVNKKSLFILSIALKPMEFLTWVAQRSLGLSDGSTALMGWLGAAIYCMVLGGLIGWGVSMLYSKATGDE